MSFTTLLFSETEIRVGRTRSDAQTVPIFISVRYLLFSANWVGVFCKFLALILASTRAGDVSNRLLVIIAVDTSYRGLALGATDTLYSSANPLVLLANLLVKLLAFACADSTRALSSATVDFRSYPYSTLGSSGLLRPTLSLASCICCVISLARAMVCFLGDVVARL